MAQKQCQKCEKSFSVDANDDLLYQKLGVPQPTFCPQCRNQRRMAWRNDRTFYLRKCAKSGRNIITIYAPETPFTLYHQDEWWKDHWDGTDYGCSFDFSRPFFDQFFELQRKVPRMSVAVVNCQNSDYCNYCTDLKNCYFDLAAEANEDCYYNLFVKYSKDCMDCTFVYNSTLCYETINSHNAYSNAFCMYTDDSSDCYFSYDLKGCKNCLFSHNLRNKEYHIQNKAYSKEEYEQKLRELNMGSYEQLERIKSQWLEYRLQHGIYRDTYLQNCENSTGNDLKNCKNTQSSFNATNCEDGKYLYDVLDAKDCQDLNYSLYDPEVAYELISTVQNKYSAFNMEAGFNSNIFYCNQVFHSANLFGCVGLKRRKYCILNKQYSKEEYEALIPRIIEHMGGPSATGAKGELSINASARRERAALGEGAPQSGATGAKGELSIKEWGQFFPAERAPFGYNETVAQEYMPLSKEEATALGFNWKDKDPKQYQPQSYKIPHHINDVPDSIVDEVLACSDCGRNYKVISQELAFYRKRVLPIPRKCDLCRHLDRMQLRTPRRLWERQCMKCQAPIHTSFAPNRREVVYCEQCYLAALY